MSTTQGNFYKPNSSKLKLQNVQNVYPYDSFRPGNLNEYQIRGKSSSPSTKINMQKDILKSIKGNNFQNNNFNSYNMSYKFNDIVNKKTNKYFFTNISSLFKVIKKGQIKRRHKKYEM